MTTATAPESQKPKFSIAVAVLLLLGMASLGLVAAAPYLEKPAYTATEGFARDYGKQSPKGLDESPELDPVQMPAYVGGVALLSLLAAVVLRRFTFPSLFLAWLAVVGSAGLLLVGLFLFKDHYSMVARNARAVETRKAAGTLGDVTIHPGQQHNGVVAGAAGACLFFVLAAAWMHRRWWSRTVAFVVLGAIVALAPLWIYREELGLAPRIPEEWQEMIGF